MKTRHFRSNASCISSSAVRQVIRLTVVLCVIATPLLAQTGSQVSQPKPISAASSVRNPVQIAILRWYDANQGAVLDLNRLGVAPQNMLCFDGSSMWVASAGIQNISKVRASDGAILGTYPTYWIASAAVFDGFNIWISDFGSGGVSKIRAKDGAWLGKFGSQASSALAYDGANIWVANSENGTVSKLWASDGRFARDLSCRPTAGRVGLRRLQRLVAVANDSTVKKLRVTDGVVLGTYFLTTAQLPLALAFDGTSIRVAGHHGAVARLRASNGALIGTYAVGYAPDSVVFDGANIWVASQGNSNVIKLRDFDGANLGTFGLGSVPESMVFDGANIWVAKDDNTLSKL